jgi:antiviral helicase SLH1
MNRGYGDRSFVYAPKFPKPQQEGWFIIAVDASEEKLLNLQRLTLSGRGAGESSVELDIPAGYVGNSLKIMVISDGWRDIKVEKSIAWEAEQK